MRGYPTVAKQNGLLFSLIDLVISAFVQHRIGAMSERKLLGNYE